MPRSKRKLRLHAVNVKRQLSAAKRKEEHWKVDQLKQEGDWVKGQIAMARNYQLEWNPHYHKRNRGLL